jgi:hypothetical protein
VDCGLWIHKRFLNGYFSISNSYLKNCFLTADLDTKTAVYAGQPINLHSAILSSYQGGALESFETVAATNTGTYRGHLHR